MDYSELEEQKDYIKDENYFTILRVYMDELDVVPDSQTRKAIEDEYEVGFVDVKFKPVQEDKDEDQSKFSPAEYGTIFSITDEIIEDYVEENNTSLDKEDIMEGLKELREDQETEAFKLL